MSIDNKQACEFFAELSKSSTTPYTTKYGPVNDHTRQDADFLLQYLDSNKTLLDLGSGGGLLIEKLWQDVGQIVCVEQFEAFSRHIVKAENISIYNETIQEFATDLRFDVISMFGIMQYFDENEAKSVYVKYKQFLKAHGILAIKQQFGIEEDVVIESYSEAMKRTYYSNYRKLDKEINLLSQAGFDAIQTYDIYPAELNRWPNTHYYVIVARVS